jgi:hypothetical protein
LKLFLLLIFIVYNNIIYRSITTSYLGLEQFVFPFDK